MHVAAACGKASLIKLLADAGGDSSLTDQACSALSFPLIPVTLPHLQLLSIFFSHAFMHARLPSEQDGQTALHKGADYNQPSSITALMDVGADSAIVDKVLAMETFRSSVFPICICACLLSYTYAMRVSYMLHRYHPCHKRMATLLCIWP